MSNNKKVQMNYAMCADSIYMQLKKQGLQFNKKDFKFFKRSISKSNSQKSICIDGYS